MALLLYIESSPRKKRSASIQVAQAFIKSYTDAHPNNEVIYLDLWDLDMPEFDHDTIDAKYSIMQGNAQTEAQRKAWRNIEELIAQFKKADKYLFSIPMWNFSIPYKLKHYIDLIVQPSYTFSFSPEQGYQGLVTGKPAALICARGGKYGAGSGAEFLDLQVNYMETFLKFIGFTSIQEILVEPTVGPEKDKVIEAAKQKAAELATQF